MRKYENTVIDTSGDAVSGANIYVYDAGTTNEASIYSDEGVTPITQPLQSDTYGRFKFWVADGDYDIKISGTGIQEYTISDETIVDSKNAILKDGSVTYAADQPMGGFNLTGVGDFTDAQIFFGLQDFSFNVGTWALTRNSASHYSMDHSAADETSYIALDVTAIERTMASRGMKLTSVTLLYSIGTAAMDAHSAALNSVAYSNNSAPTVATFGGGLNGSLATATQTDMYVTTLTVNSPAYNTTSDRKLNLEITADNSATSVYKFYGAFLNFSYNFNG